jgi:hypothetical protein
VRGGTVAAFIAIASAAAWASIGLASCQKVSEAPVTRSEPQRVLDRTLTVGSGYSMQVYTDPVTGCEYLQSPYGLTPRLSTYAGYGGYFVKGCR